MLAEAIDSVLAQRTPALASRLQIAISDNGSRDGTEQLAAALRAQGAPLAYRRSAGDHGAARNVLGVTALARGEWCWLLSSDDALAPGAIERVLGLVDGHPDAVGITVGQAVFDVAMAGLAPTQAAAAPALAETTPLHGLDAIVGELGWMLSGLSSQIVRREAWERAAAQVLARPGAERLLYPQVAAALTMARAEPRWLWCPDKLVRVRADNLSAEVASAGRWEARLMRELDAHWSEAVGAGAARRRARARVLDAHRERSSFRRMRQSAGATAADDAALRRVYLGLYGGRPSAWLVLAPLLLPRPLLGTVAGGPPAPLAPADRDVRVHAVIPPALRAADERMLACTLENRGGARLTSSGPHPLGVAARWMHAEDGETHDGLRTTLARPLRPGRRRALHCSVVAPLRPGRWELRVAAIQEGVAWLDEGAAVGWVDVSR